MFGRFFSVNMLFLVTVSLSIFAHDSKAVDEIRLNILNLEQRILNLEMECVLNKKIDKVVLNAKKDTGFSVLNSSCGQFYISVEEVNPHLDGFKIRFSLGNTTNVTFVNPTMKIRWNTPWEIDWQAESDEMKKQNENWEKAFKENEFNLFKDIKPGCWEVIELFITPCTTKELEFVEISIETPTIRLENKI